MEKNIESKCEKCTKFTVCKYKENECKIINEVNKIMTSQYNKDGLFSIDFNCKYFISKDKDYSFPTWAFR